MTDTLSCQCPTPVMICASDKCNHTQEEHKKGICFNCHLPHTGPWISPGNQMPEEDIKNMGSEPIIEMSETKNLLYMGLRNLTFADSSAADFMASIIYNTEKKTIEMRGRMRFEDTGNKTGFQDKKPIPYSIDNYNKLKTRIQTFTRLLIKDIPLFQPTEDLFELEFSIGEDIDSITQKMNDSNRFNIGKIPKP